MRCLGIVFRVAALLCFACCFQSIANAQTKEKDTLAAPVAEVVFDVVQNRDTSALFRYSEDQKKAHWEDVVRKWNEATARYSSPGQRGHRAPERSASSAHYSVGTIALDVFFPKKQDVEESVIIDQYPGIPETTPIIL